MLLWPIILKDLKIYTKIVKLKLTRTLESPKPLWKLAVVVEIDKKRENLSDDHKDTSPTTWVDTKP